MNRMPPNVALAVTLALGFTVIMLLGRSWSLSNRLKAAQAEAQLWQSSSVSQQEALARLQSTLQSTEIALVERQAHLTTLTQQRQTQRQHLVEAKHEPVVDQWSRNLVPDAVRGLLKQGDSHGRGAL